jgi:hypothetical protein
VRELFIHGRQEGRTREVPRRTRYVKTISQEESNEIRIRNGYERNIGKLLTLSHLTGSVNEHYEQQKYFVTDS